MNHDMMCEPCNKTLESLCTGNKVNNIWYQCGQCKLDNLTFEQVEFVLQRNPDAKKDLMRITSDPDLLELARDTKLMADPLEDNKVPYDLINNPKTTLPYYTIMRGNTDGSIRL